MRLLFIMFDSNGYTGGPAINLTRMLPEFVRRGHEVFVLCFYNYAHPNASLVESKGVTCYYKEQSLKSYKIVPWILKKVQQVKPDVYVPDISTQGLLAGRWIKKNGIPVINTFRGNDDLNWGKTIFFSRKSKWQSSAIVCVNDFLKKELEQKITLQIPCKVIPSGVIPSNYISDQKQKSINIIYSGRLNIKQKDVYSILGLFMKLAEKFQFLNFTMIGNGSEKSNLHNIIAENNLSNRIEVLEPLRGVEYKKKLAEHQCIVLLSNHEGTPGALMDGMSCGLVPLVYKIDGIETLIIDGVTGVLVNDKKDDALRKMEDIINNYKLREIISKNAIKHIDQGYSLLSAVDKWESLFFELQKSGNNKNYYPLFCMLPKKEKLLIEHHTDSLLAIVKYNIKRLINLN